MLVSGMIAMNEIVEASFNLFIEYMASDGGDSQGHSQEMCLSFTYEAAMEALSSLITRRKRGDGSTRDQKFSLMSKYVKILNMEDYIAGLRIIHVAGTKGKTESGSTCTFSESILRECGFQTGLFTSPHLVDVRERYRLRGSEKVSQDLPMPPLFQFLTLLAFNIFIAEKVDVAILEVGLGGRWDATNVVKEPVVCGITSLGMDHMEILGDTLGEIAFEKAGIFKPEVPAFTVPQSSEAMVVLQERASELKIPLKVASPLDRSKLDRLELGMAGDHQFINAGLAVALCKCWLQRTGHFKDFFRNGNEESVLPEAFLKGLSTGNLPGRAQVVYDILTKSSKSEMKEGSSGDLIFYLDGAHSLESMEVCARWFINAVKEDTESSKNGVTEEFGCCRLEHNNGNTSQHNKISKRILLFNCMEVRDPMLLLPRLFDTCAASGAMPEDSSHFQCPETSPSYAFLHTDSHLKCSPANKQFACSAVISSLPSTIKWLRGCVKENPSVRVQ
ncbi:hypothetical protein ACLOJK_024680, partial [Asimina triloba]